MKKLVEKFVEGFGEEIGQKAAQYLWLFTKANIIALIQYIF